LRAAAKLSNLKSIGIIRGKNTTPLNVYTQNCGNNWHGMYIYISRSEYKLKEDTSFLED